MRRCLLVVSALCCFLPGCSLRPSITIMSYNVNNLFDAVRQGGEYPRFDPERGRWTARDVQQKIEAVAEVVRKSCPGGPDIIAFQEIENRDVLDQLCRRLPGDYPYRIIAAGSDSAVGCAVVSRLPMTRGGVIAVGHWQGRDLRPMVEVQIEWQGIEIHLINVHWKSKLGGVGATAGARDQAASSLARRMDSIIRADPSKELLVVGDFNANAGEPLLSRCGLLDLWQIDPQPPLGSFVYRGAWQTPDHILLSTALMDGSGLTYRVGSFRVFSPSFMTHQASGFPLRDSAREWRYSDHLPLLLEIEVSSPPDTEPDQ